MKIQYGIAGFITGILIGLLIGLAEMKWIFGPAQAAMLPFVFMLTVIVCAITGVRTGIRMAKRI